MFDNEERATEWDINHERYAGDILTAETEDYDEWTAAWATAIDISEAKDATERQGPICLKCNGSGKYFGRGSVINGTFIGNVGMCFACKGKGYQTLNDQARNDYYWSHIYSLEGK